MRTGADVVAEVYGWLCSLVARRRVARAWRILFRGGVSAVVSVLTDERLMDAAFEISLALLGMKGADGRTKADEFDAMLAAWCGRNKVSVPCAADRNAVREIAYAAVRCREQRRMAAAGCES